MSFLLDVGMAFFIPSAAVHISRRTPSASMRARPLRTRAAASTVRMGLDQELWEAAECDDIHLVEDLVKRGANVKSVNTNDLDKTALHLAAFQGHAMTIAKLVELGADPNVQTSTGSTALHYCAAYGHFAAINYLIQLGADTKLTND